MRISTKMMFDSGAQNQLSLQADLYKLQNQLSTGRKILTPADDPVAAAQALVVSQRQSINQQFMDNQGAAESLLAEQESRLASISDLLVAVKERLVQAGNGSYSDGDRKILAAEIRERYDELLGLANSTDSMGNYVFSGSRGNTRPFDVSGSPGARTITYSGDDGRRQLQVSSRRIMDVSESGKDVFMRISEGNGVFEFSAGSNNTGTGSLGTSSVVTGFDGNTYLLQFSTPTIYSVTTTTPGSPPTSVTSTPQTFTSGDSISLGGGGISISIGGSPAAGDQFTVEPARNQDIFSSLDQLIKTLETPAAGSPTAQAAMRNTLTNIDSNLNNALDHIVSRQTSIGARRVELEALSSFAGDLDTQYQSDLSKLQDLDYTKAISEMANRKIALEAAQASFAKVSQMSLFSYL